MNQQKDELGWDEANAKYSCADGCILEVKKQAISYFANYDENDNYEPPAVAPRNGVACDTLL